MFKTKIFNLFNLKRWFYALKLAGAKKIYTNFLLSNADDAFVKEFYKELETLDEKLINLINSKNLIFILADKISDVLPPNNSLDTYTDYHPEDRDAVTRGLCSGTIGALCIFSNVTTIQNVGAIIYHEIGHVIDFYNNWDNEVVTQALSSKTEFIEAYRKDITAHWDKIQNDNRFRLKHYIQSSTPENISLNGLSETFAHCFARINGKYDDIDIIGEYFENAFAVSKVIFEEFLSEH